MPVKKSIFNITEVLSKKVTAGVATYLIKSSDQIVRYVWLAEHEIPREKLALNLCTCWQNSTN